MCQLPFLLFDALLLPVVAVPQACAQPGICDQCPKAAAIETCTAAVVNMPAYAGLFITYQGQMCGRKNSG